MDAGTWICCGNIDQAKEYVKYNGFTNEDVKIIMYGNTGSSAVVSKKAGVCGKSGFFNHLDTLEEAKNNEIFHMD